MSQSTIVLWVYIVLLEVGGLIGFLKAGSKASIIASTVFAVPLILCAVHVLPINPVAWIVLALLLIVFGMRFAKGKKFMPSGLMLVLSAVALVALYVLR